MTEPSGKTPPASGARRYFGLGLARRLKSLWRRMAPAPRPRPLRVVESVLSWCQETAHLPVEILLTPAPIQRALPQTVEPQVHERYLQRRAYTPPVKYLTCIPNARLTGRTGWLVLPTGEYALELAYGTLAHLTADLGQNSPASARPVKKAGAYYSLLVWWSRDASYYHWVHDTLLRLYMVLPRLPAEVRFIAPADMSPYQRETLRALNIADDQLVPYTGDDVWAVEKLYFSPPSARSGHDLPAADIWLRDRMRAAYGVTQPRPSRRIFISRRASRGRAITNEAEVEACLHPLGFETFTLETLSFGQQVALFAEAEMVFGSHGAGFTNILFAEAGLHVVEVFEPSYVNTCFWTMSEALKFQYSYFFGQTAPGPDANANITVPIEKLRATLRAHGLD